MIEAIHCERPYSLNFDQSADDCDARDANLIENVFGKPYPVFPSQNDIDLALLIRDEYQRTSGRNTQLGAERMIVSVCAITEIAIRIRELAPQAYVLTRHNLFANELNVPLLCQSLRFSVDMDFAVRCPLVRYGRLLFGFCPSTRTFVSCFLRTPPCGDSPCIITRP
jgi:hypothetical protein